MTAKPNTKPRWATDAGADLVTPSSGKQDLGYAEGEMPPAPEQNWLHRHTYEWLNWLDGAIVDFEEGSIVCTDLTVTGDINHPNFTLNLNALCAAPSTAFSPNGSGYIVSTGNGTVQIAIPLRQGDRIKSVSYDRSGDGVCDINAVTIYLLDETGAVTDIGNTTESNVNAYGTTTIDVTDTTLGAKDTLYLHLSVNGANLKIYNLCVTYDHP
jgi:DNA-binding beta-propeller fold protein YncE